MNSVSSEEGFRKIILRVGIAIILYGLIYLLTELLSYLPGTYKLVMFLWSIYQLILAIIIISIGVLVYKIAKRSTIKVSLANLSSIPLSVKRQHLASIFLLVITLSALIPVGMTIATEIGMFPFAYGLSGQTQLKRFASNRELQNFVTEMRTYMQNWYERTHRHQEWGFTLTAGEGRGASPTPGGQIYSKTNIQVEGVDEADIVKTDGEYIYVVSGNNVIILKAYPAEEARVLSRIALNDTLSGIFINGDKLVVLGGGWSKTFIKVYDISDRESPVLTRNFSMDGSYIDSRMIGDYVYAVINLPAYNYEGEVALPKSYSDDEVEEISATQIYYSDIPDWSYTLTSIVAVNLQNDKQKPTHETFLFGAARNIYVPLDNIYITLTRYAEIFDGAESTIIHRIHIQRDAIEWMASGEVPGYVLNQFSMDEHEGHVRIATTTGHVARSWEEATSRNNVYVLDMNLQIVGKLEDLAPGERIYSARFMGYRCYLVTFRKVDPLFVIDLENPYKPKVLGYLKITGYSDYLHPYDENHIIGIGKETVAAEEGDFAWYQGVKISLFDVSDIENPKQIANYTIGDRGTDSPILRDHKAFLFDRSKNLLVIPVSVAEIDETDYPEGVPKYAYGELVWQGAYVFRISLDQGLVFRDGITHIENDADLTKSEYYVKRGLYIDDVLYTISDKKIKMNDLENLDKINEVELP